MMPKPFSNTVRHAFRLGARAYPLARTTRGTIVVLALGDKTDHKALIKPLHQRGFGVLWLAMTPTEGKARSGAFEILTPVIARHLKSVRDEIDHPLFLLGLHEGARAGLVALDAMSGAVERAMLIDPFGSRRALAAKPTSPLLVLSRRLRNAISYKSRRKAHEADPATPPTLVLTSTRGSDRGADDLLVRMSQERPTFELLSLSDLRGDDGQTDCEQSLEFWAAFDAFVPGSTDPMVALS